MSELDETLMRCYHILEEEPAVKEDDTEYCVCANQIRHLHDHEQPTTHKETIYA